MARAGSPIRDESDVDIPDREFHTHAIFLLVGVVVRFRFLVALRNFLTGQYYPTNHTLTHFSPT